MIAHLLALIFAFAGSLAPAPAPAVSVSTVAPAPAAPPAPPVTSQVHAPRPPAPSRQEPASEQLPEEVIGRQVDCADGIGVGTVVDAAGTVTGCS